MTSADDRTLLRRYHEDGDLAAREELIEQYMSLVRSLARRYSYRGEQLDDLVQIGAIGLIKAIDRFDIERGVEPTPEGFRLTLEEPAYGVATGQTAVLYEGDVVVGSGTIASSAP